MLQIIIYDCLKNSHIELLGEKSETIANTHNAVPNHSIGITQ